jgi:predicted site-specific integrase-resolvase
MEGWANTKNAEVSQRTLRTWLKEGLRHAKLPTGTIRIRYDAVDAFLEQFADSQHQVDAVVDQLFSELKTK